MYLSSGSVVARSCVWSLKPGPLGDKIPGAQCRGWTLLLYAPIR